jgi:alcohol dehydrogenase
MDGFAFRLRTEIEFGFGVSGRVGERARSLGGSRVLVVTDRGVKAAGLVEPVLETLRSQGLPAVMFDDVAPNPRESSVAQGAALAAQEACDLLIAVGGGSPMDTAKGIAVVLAHGGSVLDYGTPGMILPGQGTPVITIPTTAGSGSEVTYLAIITDSKNSTKTTVASPFMAPRLTLVDPELTLGLPRALTASTGMDALTHCIEGYTNRASHPVSDSLALTAISLLGRSLPVAYADGSKREARAEVMLASLLSGVVLTSTRTSAAHAMAEAAAALYDLPHGIANAIYLPVVMEHNLIALPVKYADIARALGEELGGLSRRECARTAVGAVYALAADLGIPRAEQVGVRPADFARMAAMASQDPCLDNNPRTLTDADLIALYERAQ